MKKMLGIYIIISILFPDIIHAQQMHLFGDSLVKLRPVSPGQVINQGIYSYISNASTDGSSRSVSALIKVDTSGKTIWTSYPTNFIASGIENVNIAFGQCILGNDNNLYTLFNNGKLAKVRASNGSIDWMVPLTPVVGGSATLMEYDAQTVVYANTVVTLNTVRLIRYDKSKGQNLGYVDLRCPGQAIFGLYISPNGNIFLASRDSCYKYTSFDNPTFEWRVAMCTGGDRYLNIHQMAADGNNLLIFGNKESGFHNGIISCVDMSNGTLKWFSKNGGSYDLYYADHKVKNGFLYTAWQHLYVGSISEKCFINKTNINTGVKSWEFNFAFRTQAVFNSKGEAMESLDIDANETIFLTGYGLPDDQTEVHWGFMKIRGADGAVLKRSYVPGSTINQDYPVGYTGRLLNGKLYTTGRMPGNIAGGSVDTSSLAPLKTNLYTSSIQYTSSVVGIKNLSADKKVIVKKVGKQLKVEMVDAFFNKLWERKIGDTLNPYEGVDVLGGNDTARAVDVPARQYSGASNNHFYFSQVAVPDLFYIFRYDSTGAIKYQYTHGENGTVTVPYQFFQDSLGRSWFGYTESTFIHASLFPSTINPPGVISIGGVRWPKPYQLIKPSVYVPYSKDTVLYFMEPTSSTLNAALRKTWQDYLPIANTHYWYWPSLRIKWINSAEREDKNNYYIAAKDSSLKDLIFKYRVSDSTFMWSKKFDSTIVTLKGYSLNGSFYALSTQANDVFIRKFNGATGDITWTQTIGMLPGNIFRLGDFAMSKERQKFTVAGCIIDTLIKTMSKLYIITFDTSGNVINSYLSDGYKAWQNKGVSVNIGQDGQTMVSGQITDSTYGYAGFIYEVDATSLGVSVPTPKIINIVSSICSDLAQKSGKVLNPIPAPYTISIVMDNNILIPFNPSDSSFSYSIANAGTHTVRITYTYQNYSSFKDTSFIVKATPSSGSAPTQVANVLTAPVTGSSYQWYLNGTIITGATSQTITITQGGLYNYTYGVNGCLSPISTSLNAVITSISDPTNNNAIITFFPNPTTGSVVINNLNPSYQYGIKIFDYNGQRVKDLFKLPRGNSSIISLEALQPGIYILQLRNLTKKVLIGNQQVVVIK